MVVNIEQNNTPDGYKWTALSVASLGTLVGILNASTLIIALPTMMVKLNTDLFGIMWVLIIYMLFMTILAPAWGRLADIHGRKKLYVYGLAVFTVGSLLCGFAANLNQLIAFRVIQAVGGSMLVANGTIIVADAFKRSELGKAMGILSMIVAAAFVVGPILGGFLTMIDWRLNFFINVPIGIITTLWAHYKLKEVAELPKGETFDLKGMVLFTIAFLTSMIYLTAGFVLGLISLPMLLSLVIAIVSFAAFLGVEKRAFFNSAGMVLSMGISFPLIMGTISLEQMMNMFVVGGASMPVAVQEAFTSGLTNAFIISSIIIVPAIIVSALRGKENN